MYYRFTLLYILYKVIKLMGAKVVELRIEDLSQAKLAYSDNSKK